MNEGHPNGGDNSKSNTRACYMKFRYELEIVLFDTNIKQNCVVEGGLNDLLHFFFHLATLTCKTMFTIVSLDLLNAAGNTVNPKLRSYNRV